jgi:hypothetical protein
MNQNSELRAFLRSRWGVGAMAFLGVTALLLLFEHWTHIAGSNLVASLLLLACVGMHLFMHAGLGGHGGGSKE